MLLLLILCQFSFITAIPQTAFNVTDEMSFRLLRPTVPIVDIEIPKKKCKGGICNPEIPLDSKILERYRAYARMMTVGYCRSALINEWSCGVCNEPGSTIKNTTDIRFFRTKYHTVHGVMAVNHDLGKVFLALQGVQHKIQWWVSSRGFSPVKLNTKFSNRTINSTNIKVHSNILIINNRGISACILDYKENGSG